MRTEASPSSGSAGGRYGARELTARAAGSQDATDWQIGAAFAKFDGFPARRGASVDSGHDNLNLNAAITHRVGDTTLNARVLHATGNTEYLDSLGVPKDQDFTNAVMAVALTQAFSERWTSHVDVSLAGDDIEQNQSADFAQTQRLALDWQNTVTLSDAHTLVAGVYAFSENTESLVFGTGFDEDTDLLALYLADNISIGAHRASLAARYSDHETFGGQATWHADYTYLIGERIGLHAATGRAFRAPDATDRFGFGGNADLNPEVSRTVEAAVSFRPDARQRLRFGMFDLAIGDLIAFDFDPATFVGVNRNIAEARIRGVEAQYQWRASDWGLQASRGCAGPEQ